jgi:hypothetical protein
LISRGLLTIKPAVKLLVKPVGAAGIEPATARV